MGGTQTGPVQQLDESAIAALLQELDAAGAGKDAGWTNKRAEQRRRIALPCTVRYVGPDGTTVLAAPAKSRDISLRGLAFVAQAHFRRGVPILVVMPLPGGQVKHLTGSVVHSRPVKDGWCLTGVKMAPLGDQRLLVEDVVAVTNPESSTPKPQTPTQAEPASPASAREQALRLLNESSSSGWRLSQAKIAKVFDLCLSPDHVVRRATIPVLMQIGGQQSAEYLIRFLQDSNTDVQAEATDALGQMRAKEALEPLAELLKGRTEDLALRAAEALGRLGDQRGLRIAAEIVRRDTPANRRAARALGIIVGQEFRPNSDGVTAARRYLKEKKIPV